MATQHTTMCFDMLLIFTLFHVLAFEVLIPTEDSLMMVENITLPNVSLSVFENMTPMFQIPSVVLLNQIKKEGTIQCVFCAAACGNSKLLHTFVYVQHLSHFTAWNIIFVVVHILQVNDYSYSVQYLPFEMILYTCT